MSDAGNRKQLYNNTHCLQLKDARSVSFRSILFTSFILTIFKNVWKNVFVENVWPAILLCLLTFRPNASKKLKSLTTINALSWLGGAVVTHPRWVHEVPGSIPSSGKGFMFDFLFCCCCVFTFLSKTHNLWQKFAIPFTILIYLVYLRYCKIYDRL